MLNTFSGWRKVFEEGPRGRIDNMLYNGEGKLQVRQLMLSMMDKIF